MSMVAAIKLTLPKIRENREFPDGYRLGVLGESKSLTILSDGRGFAYGGILVATFAKTPALF